MDDRVTKGASASTEHYIYFQQQPQQQKAWEGTEAAVELIEIRSAGERAPAPLSALLAVIAWMSGLEILSEHWHHTSTKRKRKCGKG